MALPTIAALTPSDWDVEIHDARTTSVDYDKKVDLVGITSYTADITNACKIAVVFRSEGVKVVMGGSLSFIYKKQGYQTLWYFDIIGPDLSFRCTYVLSVYK